jgi:hypothetical protein
VIIKNTEQLSDLEAVYRRIKAFKPASDTELQTKQILLELARSRRDELRRELVKPRIKVKKRAA